jgi:3-dehydro-L-gulonate 2-dehydrogenase
VLRIPYQELFDALLRVLLKLEFTPARARLCAQLFADTTRDGVYSHGLNRFPRFVSMVRNRYIDVHAEPALVTASGPIERWDGNLGPGNLNAWHSMERAIRRAHEHGMGCVALANTNHWMRGGSYGWQAADAGVIGICWTNTLPNLPPWGASDPRVGNNPLVIAVPRTDGHVVLDMAMSQFSYGALASYRARGELLPVDGGFDQQGRLTRVPAEIEASHRLLPIGFWKGSGLALMLDLLAATLTGGKATHQITADPNRENGQSQVFIAFNVSLFDRTTTVSRIADQVIENFQLPPNSHQERIRYPGYRVLITRRDNLANGIPVEPSVWQRLDTL